MQDCRSHWLWGGQSVRGGVVRGREAQASIAGRPAGICCVHARRWRKIEQPKYLRRWIDLSAVWSKHSSRRGNLRTCVEAAGLAWQGRAHSAIDDALNTARCAPPARCPYAGRFARLPAAAPCARQRGGLGWPLPAMHALIVAAPLPLQAGCEAHAGRLAAGHHRFFWQPGRLWPLQTGGPATWGTGPGHQAERGCALPSWQAALEAGTPVPLLGSCLAADMRPAAVKPSPKHDACALLPPCPLSGHAAGPGHRRCQGRWRPEAHCQRQGPGPRPAGGRAQEEAGV